MVEDTEFSRMESEFKREMAAYLSQLNQAKILGDNELIMKSIDVLYSSVFRQTQLYDGVISYMDLLKKKYPDQHLEIDKLKDSLSRMKDELVEKLNGFAIDLVNVGLEDEEK